MTRFATDLEARQFGRELAIELQLGSEHRAASTAAGHAQAVTVPPAVTAEPSDLRPLCSRCGQRLAVQRGWCGPCLDWAAEKAHDHCRYEEDADR